MRLTYITILCIAFGFTSCSNPEVNSVKNYVDIKGFFENEIKRLTKTNTRVNKTVSSFNKIESKIVANINWKNELSLFVSSDINKPAWKNSYKLITNPN